MPSVSRDPVPVPVAVVAAGRPARQVWDNPLGGRTFEVGSGADRLADIPPVDRLDLGP
jgi:hypothetical protein